MNIANAQQNAIHWVVGFFVLVRAKMKTTIPPTPMNLNEKIVATKRALRNSINVGPVVELVFCSVPCADLFPVGAEYGFGNWVTLELPVRFVVLRMDNVWVHRARTEI